MNCIFYRPLEEVIRIHEEKQVQFSQSLHFKQKNLENIPIKILLGNPPVRLVESNSTMLGFSRNLFQPEWNLIHAFFQRRFFGEKRSRSELKILTTFCLFVFSLFSNRKKHNNRGSVCWMKGFRVFRCFLKRSLSALY